MTVFMSSGVPIGCTVPINAPGSLNRPTFTEENENFFRFALLLIDGGKEALEFIFHTRYSSSLSLKDFLKRYQTILSNLHKKKVIISPQWDLLFPTPKIQQWDISLLYVLLRNICLLQPPSKGWTNLPDANDLSTSADIERLRCFRNKFQGHIAAASMSNADFQASWNDLSQTILRLTNNTMKNKVDNILTASFDCSLQRDLLEKIHQWIVADRGEQIMEFLKNLRETVDQLKQYSEDQSRKLEKTLSTFEDRVAKQLQKVQDNDRNIEKIQEKLSQISNETFGSLLRTITRNDNRIETAMFHFQQIIASLETIKDSLDHHHRELLELQIQTNVKLDEQQDLLKCNNKAVFDSLELNKAADHKLNAIISYLKSSELHCLRGMCRDLSDERESFDEDKDDSADPESIKHLPFQACNGNKSEENKVVMKCIHCYYSYTRKALLAQVSACLENGDFALFCYKCREEWEYTNVREQAGWSDSERQGVERKLSLNYITKNREIKQCPECKNFCIRKDANNIRVVCLFCSNHGVKYEFCWLCLKNWNSSGTKHCCSSGNRHCI